MLAVYHASAFDCGQVLANGKYSHILDMSIEYGVNSSLQAAWSWTWC